MANLKDVMDLAKERQYVSISLLRDKLDLSTAQACRVLQACWQRGLLLPTALSWFAEPDEDGGPVEFEGKSAMKRKLTWYRPELAAVREYIEGHEGLGFTVQDISHACAMDPNRARNVLKVMVEINELIVGEASGGGAFGKRPKIFGPNLEAIRKRDKLLTLKRKMAKGKKAAPSSAEVDGSHSHEKPFDS